MRIFTNEQYEELKTYGKQIEDFIRSEICPKAYTDIMLQIGTETSKLGNPRYRLIVDRYGIRGYSGHLGIQFIKELVSSECGRDVYVYDSWNYGAEYLYQLCSNWKSGTNVKQKLIDAIDAQPIKKGRVFADFTV